jgi:hypothetical protein
VGAADRRHLNVEARTEPVPGGRRYRLRACGGPLSFRGLFTALAGDATAADRYSELLLASGLRAAWWEFPALRGGDLDRPAEFVLLDAPALDRLTPDPGPFSNSFETAPDDDVVSFPNLGGDALLIVPRPVGADSQYVHLLAFLRNAPRPQARELWRMTAGAMLRETGDDPVWLSTAGLGVAWLHVRLDSRPKYYSHAPYKAAG